MSNSSSTELYIWGGTEAKIEPILLALGMRRDTNEHVPRTPTGEARARRCPCYMANRSTALSFHAMPVPVMPSTIALPCSI